MKKILTFAVLAVFAITSSAATVKWGTSGAIYFGETKVKSNVTGYLYSLGTDASWDLVTLDFDSILGGTDSNIAGTKKSSSTQSKVAGETAFDVGDQFGSHEVTDKISNFGVLYIYTSGEDLYYNLGSIYTYDTTSDSYNSDLQTFTWTNDAIASNQDFAKQGWTAVPEPASAMLALAGVAMLIRRRK